MPAPLPLDYARPRGPSEAPVSLGWLWRYVVVPLLLARGCVAALPRFSTYGANVAIDRMQRAQTLDTYTELAKAAGIAQRIATAAVKAAVSAAQDTWPKMLHELPTPQGMKEVILDRLKTLSLASL